jgi:hypothetical protein
MAATMFASGEPPGGSIFDDMRVLSGDNPPLLAALMELFEDKQLRIVRVHQLRLPSATIARSFARLQFDETVFLTHDLAQRDTWVTHRCYRGYPGRWVLKENTVKPDGSIVEVQTVADPLDDDSMKSLLEKAQLNSWDDLHEIVRLSVTRIYTRGEGAAWVDCVSWQDPRAPVSEASHFHYQVATEATDVGAGDEPVAPGKIVAVLSTVVPVSTWNILNESARAPAGDCNGFGEDHTVGSVDAVSKFIHVGDIPKDWDLFKHHGLGGALVENQPNADELDLRGRLRPRRHAQAGPVGTFSLNETVLPWLRNLEPKRLEHVQLVDLRECPFAT